MAFSFVPLSFQDIDDTGPFTMNVRLTLHISSPGSRTNDNYWFRSEATTQMT